MSLIDRRGRIGGKVNLLDMVVATAVIGLALVSYLAYLMFRTPTPSLLSITPSSIHERENVNVTVRGKNLRPYMRITFSNARARREVVLWDAKDLVTARTYVRGDSTYATFELPELLPGTYDVLLWNAQREITRLPNALTILPLPPTTILEVDVDGTFTRVASAQATALKAGATFNAAGAPAAAVLDARPPTPSTMRLRAGVTTTPLPIDGYVDVPATLRITCFTVSNADGSVRCAVPGPVQQSDVVPNSNFWLKTSSDWVQFHISEVRPPSRRGH